MELSRIPAFGFERSLNDAYHAHCRAMKKAPLPLVLGSRIDLGASWHTVKTNAAKVAGYFPGVGMIVGLGRFITFLKDKECAYSKNHVVRAMVEGSNFGCVLLVPDIITTIARNKDKDPQQVRLHEVRSLKRPTIQNRKVPKALAIIGNGFLRTGDALAYTAIGGYKNVKRLVRH